MENQDNIEKTQRQLEKNFLQRIVNQFPLAPKKDCRFIQLHFNSSSLSPNKGVVATSNFFQSKQKVRNFQPHTVLKPGKHKVLWRAELPTFYSQRDGGRLHFVYLFETRFKRIVNTSETAAISEWKDLTLTVVEGVKLWNELMRELSPRGFITVEEKDCDLILHFTCQSMHQGWELIYTIGRSVLCKSYKLVENEEKEFVWKMKVSQNFMCPNRPSDARLFIETCPPIIGLNPVSTGYSPEEWNNQLHDFLYSIVPFDPRIGPPKKTTVFLNKV